MVTGSMISGRLVLELGLSVPSTRMVLRSSAGVLGSSGMAKLMVSVSVGLLLELAAVIAPRSEQSLAATVQSSAVGVVTKSGSSLLSTVKVVAAWAGLAVSTRAINTATQRARTKQASVHALSVHMVLSTAMPLSIRCSALGRSAEQTLRPVSSYRTSVAVGRSRPHPPNE